MVSTKEKIQKNALKLFAKQGVKNTPTAQITKDAGVASGTLFVHYKSKQVLIDSLYLNIKRKAFSSFDKAYQIDCSVEQNIKSTTKVMVEYFVSHYNEFVFLEQVDTDPLVSEEVVALGYENYQDFIESFKCWAEEGHFKELDFDLIHQIKFSMIKTLIKYLKSNKLKEVSEKQLDAVWDAIKK